MQFAVDFSSARACYVTQTTTGSSSHCTAAVLKRVKQIAKGCERHNICHTTFLVIFNYPSSRRMVHCTTISSKLSINLCCRSSSIAWLQNTNMDGWGSWQAMSSVGSGVSLHGRSVSTNSWDHNASKDRDGTCNSDHSKLETEREKLQTCKDMTGTSFTKYKGRRRGVKCIAKK